MKEYEVAVQRYNDEWKIRMEESQRLNNLLDEFIKVKSELNDIVPEEYRDKVYSYAYNQSHSEGHTGIYNTLCELVNIFRK